MSSAGHVGWICKRCRNYTCLLLRFIQSHEEQLKAWHIDATSGHMGVKKSIKMAWIIILVYISIYAVYSSRLSTLVQDASTQTKQDDGDIVKKYI